MITQQLIGTGVRDYIHVVDLALGHLAALNVLAKGCGLLTVNLGAGRGYSVLELVLLLKRQQAKAFLIKLSIDVLGILPVILLMHHWQNNCSAGKRLKT